ncbi:MAG: hypothetical protein ACKVJU_25260 [Verrucomicrobiales bacterium]
MSKTALNQLGIADLEISFLAYGGPGSDSPIKGLGKFEMIRREEFFLRQLANRAPSERAEFFMNFKERILIQIVGFESFQNSIELKVAIINSILLLLVKP